MPESSRIGTYFIFRPNRAATLAATFIATISLIVKTCSYKQMVRSNTRGIIAVMAHKESVRNFAIGKFIRYSMNSDCFASARDFPISIFADKPCPNPTLVGLIHVSPKAFYHWLSLRAGKASSITLSVGFQAEPPLFVAQWAFSKYMKTSVISTNVLRPSNIANVIGHLLMTSFFVPVGASTFRASPDFYLAGIP